MVDAGRQHRPECSGDSWIPKPNDAKSLKEAMLGRMHRVLLSDEGSCIGKLLLPNQLSKHGSRVQSDDFYSSAHLACAWFIEKHGGTYLSVGTPQECRVCRCPIATGHFWEFRGTTSPLVPKQELALQISLVVHDTPLAELIEPLPAICLALEDLLPSLALDITLPLPLHFHKRLIRIHLKSILVL